MKVLSWYKYIPRYKNMHMLETLFLNPLCSLTKTTVGLLKDHSEFLVLIKGFLYECQKLSFLKRSSQSIERKPCPFPSLTGIVFVLHVLNERSIFKQQTKVSGACWSKLKHKRFVLLKICGVIILFLVLILCLFILLWIYLELCNTLLLYLEIPVNLR